MTSRTVPSNFDDREVVSKPKSGVRVIRLKLSDKAKESLASKSPGIRSSSKDGGHKKKDEEESEDHGSLVAC